MPKHHSPPLFRASDLIREQEERHRAWLHDTVLQVLEYLATGGYGECSDREQMMRVAANAADELRHAIDDDGEPQQQSPADFFDGLLAVVNEAREMSSLDVRLDLAGPVNDIQPELGDEIIGVVREALTNTRKHAQAHEVLVQCAAHDGGIDVHVVDDGIGFDPQSQQEGIGIRCSMRQRMARCGGRVAIDSAPGRGVDVHITSMTGISPQESVA